MTNFIEIPLIGGEDMIYWLRKLHHRDQEEKSILHEDQDTLMGDILNLQYTIGRNRRDEK